jgi:hypothetical protein
MLVEAGSQQDSPAQHLADFAQLLQGRRSGSQPVLLLLQSPFCHLLLHTGQIVDSGGKLGCRSSADIHPHTPALLPPIPVVVAPLPDSVPCHVYEAPSSAPPEVIPPHATRDSVRVQTGQKGHAVEASPRRYHRGQHRQQHASASSASASLQQHHLRISSIRTIWGLGRSAPTAWAARYTVGLGGQECRYKPRKMPAALLE